MIYDCRAYNRLVKETGPEKRLPGLPYSQRQLFWMASANVWSVIFSVNSKNNSKKYLFPTKTADSAQTADQITNYV